MRALAAVAAMILIVGVVGVIVTLLGYIVAILLAIAGFCLMSHFARMAVEKVAAKGRHSRANIVTEQDAAAARAAEFERSTRDPRWVEAVDRRRAQRQELVDKFIDLNLRVRKLPPSKRDSLEPEVRRVDELVRQTFNRRVSAVQPDVRKLLDVEPPADEVFALDREFALTSDCRYGHWGEHAIEQAGAGLVLRRCLFCQPNTRWTERI